MGPTMYEIRCSLLKAFQNIINSFKQDNNIFIYSLQYYHLAPDGDDGDNDDNDKVVFIS